jgi:hypothetical protein
MTSLLEKCVLADAPDCNVLDAETVVRFGRVDVLLGEPGWRSS